MKIHDRVETFSKLGHRFQRLTSTSPDANEDSERFETLLRKTAHKNPWFTNENVRLAFSAWAEELKGDKITRWLMPYMDALEQKHAPKTIGVINAGNIPLVGFHDLLSVIISGNKYMGKNSADDPYLLPFVSEILSEIEPKMSEVISFSEKLTGFDAVIATGSNNSARYFDYYFGKYPHIIRMNRNAVAVLTGDETEDDFKNLGRDIFQYFGLGCRNISKLYVPRGYSFNFFFESIESFSSMAQHNKYMNNHDYNNAIYLLKKIPFLDNGFLLVKEDEAIASPISVLYYEFYDDLKAVEQKLADERVKIQCVVSKVSLSSGEGLGVRPVRLGQSQRPQLREYADGVDTMKFLLGLRD